MFITFFVIVTSHKQIFIFKNLEKYIEKNEADLPICQVMAEFSKLF